MHTVFRNLSVSHLGRGEWLILTLGNGSVIAQVIYRF